MELTIESVDGGHEVCCLHVFVFMLCSCCLCGFVFMLPICDHVACL